MKKAVTLLAKFRQIHNLSNELFEANENVFSGTRNLEIMLRKGAFVITSNCSFSLSVYKRGAR